MLGEVLALGLTSAFGLPDSDLDNWSQTFLGDSEILFVAHYCCYLQTQKKWELVSAVAVSRKRFQPRPNVLLLPDGSGTRS